MEAIGTLSPTSSSLAHYPPLPAWSLEVPDLGLYLGGAHLEGQLEVQRSRRSEAAGRSNRLVLLTATRRRPTLHTPLLPKGSELERLRVGLKSSPTTTVTPNPEVSRKWLLLEPARAGDQETDIALSDLTPLHCAAVGSQGQRAGLRVVNGTSHIIIVLHSLGWLHLGHATGPLKIRFEVGGNKEPRQVCEQEGDS